MPQLITLWEDNYRVCKARKLWKAAQRAGVDVGRDQVARLMRWPGSRGSADREGAHHPPGSCRSPASGPGEAPLAGRSAAPAVGHRPDLRPDLGGDRLVCFILDAFSRMIVGWRVAAHMRTPWCSTPWRWPAGRAAPGWTGCGVTAMPGRGSCRCATASGSPRSARSPRSVASGTRSTTPWPRRSTATASPS